MSHRPIILLVTGYRGMGKDYIALNGIQNHVLFQSYKSVPFETLFQDISSCKKKKFASPLRLLLKDYFYTPITDDEYDQQKDNRTFLPYDGSIRDFFIEIARATRSVDPDFFAKRLDLEIKSSENQEDEHNYEEFNDHDFHQNYIRCSKFERSKFIVTDWRYPNEYEYLRIHNDVFTLRVHREIDADGKHITIPSHRDESEHSLDDFATDFVVVPKSHYNQNYEGLVHRFGWAQNFIMKTSIA